MKILFVAHQFFPDHSAGVETVTLGISRELKARGHESHVLAPKRSIEGDIRPGELEDYEYEGIPVRRIGRPEEGFSRPYHLNYRNDTMARRVREYMKEIQPDIVHVMHLQGLSASVLPVFEEFGAPVVYTASDFWTICPVVDLRRHDGVMCRGPDLHHCIRCIASRDPDSRMNATMNRTPDAALKTAGLFSRTPLSRFSHPLRQVKDLRERPVYIREKMEHVDRVIAYTRIARDLLVANGVGERKIEVSTYGIDTSDIVKAPKNRDLPPPLRVGFIGTLAPHKGCDILIRAFKQLSGLDASLAIYGDLERYEGYVEELRGLAERDRRIFFLGVFSWREIGRVLSEIDVLVVPSRWYENAPSVIYAAFAAGTPVIVTDLGGMSEVVEPEKNGLLSPLESPDDLARQLRRVGEEPGLLEKLRAGIGPVKTVEENVDELEELYEELLEERA
ncbi:MAG: glycosyltransferase family 4 protein [Rubrobacteraceae bacterium]